MLRDNIPGQLIITLYIKQLNYLATSTQWYKQNQNTIVKSMMRKINCKLYSNVMKNTGIVLGTLIGWFAAYNEKIFMETCEG